jgi:PAS domain S-box-containing protein
MLDMGRLYRRLALALFRKGGRSAMLSRGENSALHGESTGPPPAREQEQALHTDRELHEALLRVHAELGEGLLLIADQRISYANDAFCRLSGFSREELLALPSFLGLVHPAEREFTVANYRRRIAGASFVSRYETALLCADGARRDCEIALGTVSPADPRRLVVIVTDITERKRMEAEAGRLAAELELRVQERTAELLTVNRELESFAYSISHDLRSPLRAIDGFSKLLLDEYGERLDRQGANYLERVRRAAQRMGTLIDDLLELSRVTRQGMRRDRVDLSLLASDVLEELAKAMPQRRVLARVEPGCTAVGDPQLLRVLMQNLLDNAWKYTAHRPEARIEFGREPGEDGGVAFYVRDNGAGFDMRYADRLFVPFQRLHRPEEFEGSGVGLASVARVAHRHGGKVWAESSPGRGATFRFTLGEPRDFRP